MGRDFVLQRRYNPFKPLSLIKEMKIDPYKHEERYLGWKERVKDGIPSLDKENSDIILKFIEDMEYGINISNKNVKGSRSYIRLNTLREKMCFFANNFKERYNVVPLTKISEIQVCKFFSEMASGGIKRQDGKNYQSVADYVKVFKSFWHWYQKSSKKQGVEIPEITDSLDTRRTKPKWVYLDEEQIKKITDSAKFEYKVLITFLIDTGIRAPTELVNIKVSDLFNDFKELSIQDEISKTFGRRIKLMICSDILRDYTKKNLNKRFRSLNEFLSEWNIFDQKRALVEELENQGLILDALREEVPNGKEYDPFDLILHIAYGKKPLTRNERAKKVKKDSYFEKYGKEARQVIEALLQKYADEGIENLEDAEVLRVDPLRNFGRPLEIMKIFGGKAGYQKMIKEIEERLYRS